MNTLRYKGYIGSVAYSEPDKVFFGTIEGIDDLVTYEGESVAELTSSFQEAVDDYLIFCEEHNLKPEKSYTGTFNVRISPTTHRQIANRAAAAGISINAFVKKALDESVQQSMPSNSRLVGYDSQAPEPAMLMEPDSPRYCARNTVKFAIPNKDISFAKELAKHLGWEEI